MDQVTRNVPTEESKEAGPATAFDTHRACTAPTLFSEQMSSATHPDSLLSEMQLRVHHRARSSHGQEHESAWSCAG